MNRSLLRSSMAVAASLALGATVQAAPVLTFVSHGEYLANATHAPVAIDPEVFVQDPNAPATTGPEGIAHVAGIRPARLADDPSLPLSNAQGDPLSLSLGRWIAAAGVAEVLPAGDDDQHVRLRFTNLVAFGVYSVFVVKTSPDGTSVRPLGDAGTSFTASIDGFAEVTPALNQPLGPGDALELIYHSDDAAHGSEPGDMGITAHRQLIVAAGDAATSTEAPQQPDADATEPPASQASAPPPAAPAQTPVAAAPDGPDMGPDDSSTPAPRPTPLPETEPVF